MHFRKMIIFDIIGQQILVDKLIKPKTVHEKHSIYHVKKIIDLSFFQKYIKYTIYISDSQKVLIPDSNLWRMIAFSRNFQT